MEKITFTTTTDFEGTLIGGTKIQNNVFYPKYKIDFWFDSDKKVYMEFMYKSQPNQFTISFCPYDSTILTEGRKANIKLKKYQEQRMMFTRMYGI